MTRYALVIGISQYQGRDKLPKATQDAEAIAQVLTDSGNYEVTRLPWHFNEAQRCKEMSAETVKGKQLEEELRTFLKRAERDEALIYFTGHGLVKPSKSGKPKGYLVASDEDNFDLDSLNDLILESPLSNLVVLLDCCHSGNFIEANIFKNTLTAFTAQKDYYFITASRGFEESFAVASDKHSIFTQALLDGMSRERADEKGRVSGDRLFDYISQAPTVSGQEPIRLGWGKSLILINYPVEKQAAIAFKNQNPYRGLLPFESEQADYFKGRETAVRVLIDRLDNNRFLAVIGASGCGKSSLVKAGLLPELKKSNNQLQIESMKPGDRPLTQLQNILTLMQRSQQTQPYILFIDQFEEVFTLCKDETERRDFIRAVTAEATIPDRQTRVIITIRSDFIERCADYQEAATLINRDLATTYFVKKLELKELLEAIEEPARKNGVSFEPGLVSQIVNDVEDQPGALPLLQFALQELWQVGIEKSTSEQRLLTKTHYNEIGGVEGALNQQANFVYERLMSDAEKESVKDLFMELVEVEENQPVTRRRVTRESLVAIGNSQEQLQKQQLRRTVLGKLVDQRLIVTDENTVENTVKVATVEVAHEALLSEWSLLKKWIDDNRENIRLKCRLEEARQEWQRFNKSDDSLLRGQKLTLFKEWQEESKYAISDLDAEFLQKSVKNRDREKFFLVGSGLLVLLLLALSALFYINGKTKEARLAQSQIQATKKEARLAQEGQIKKGIDTAKIFWDEHKQIEALRESIKALNDLKTANFVEPKDKLKFLDELKNIVYKAQEKNRLEGHTEEVSSLSFSHDGKLIASGSVDQTIKIWSVEDVSKQPTTIPFAHNNLIREVKFSHNSKMIASSSLDQSVKLWTSNRQRLHPRSPMMHDASVFGISFSPNDKILASSSKDGKIKLWKTDNGMPLNGLKDKHITGKQDYWIYSVDFNPKRPNDLQIVSAGFSTGNSIDSRLRLWWDVTGDQPKSDIIGSRQKDHHEGVVYIVRFSPEGDIIASGGIDNKVKLWDVKRKKLIATLSEHKQSVYGLSFSSDGSRLASASEDQTIKVWDVHKIVKMWKANPDSPLEIEKSDATLEGHSKTVRWVEFQPLKNPKNISPSAQIIASASDDKTIRLWQVNLKENNNLKLAQQNDIDETLIYACTFLKDYYNFHKNMETEKQKFCPMLILR